MVLQVLLAFPRPLLHLFHTVGHEIFKQPSVGMHWHPLPARILLSVPPAFVTGPRSRATSTLRHPNLPWSIQLVAPAVLRTKLQVVSTLVQLPPRCLSLFVDLGDPFPCPFDNSLPLSDLDCDKHFPCLLLGTLEGRSQSSRLQRPRSPPITVKAFSNVDLASTILVSGSILTRRLDPSHAPEPPRARLSWHNLRVPTPPMHRG